VEGKAKGKYRDRKLPCASRAGSSTRSCGWGNPYRKPRELTSAVLGHTALSNKPQYHAQTAMSLPTATAGNPRLPQQARRSRG